MGFSKINDMDIATIKKDLENQLGDINKELKNIYLPHDAVLIFLGKRTAFEIALELIDFQQEQQMPDSTQLIAEWGKEKAVLEQKDFRGDAERMAYNAFLDGFVKGLGYGRTE